MMLEKKEIYMQKKILLTITSVLCLFFFVVLGNNFFTESERVRIGDEEYILERAETNEERMKGLGERDALCSSCGMVFIFDHPDRYTFWMKGMRFPIDIIWLLGDEIVHIEHRVSENDQHLYTPEQESDRVIELNAGEAEMLQSGDHVDFLK